MPSTSAENSSPRRLRFKVAGMDCAGCARTIEQALGELDGVDEVRVNFMAETLECSGRAATETLRMRVGALGYRLVDPSSEATPATPAQATGFIGFLHYLWRHNETRIALALGLAVLAMIPVSAVDPSAPISSLVTVFHWLVIAVVGYPDFEPGLAFPDLCAPDHDGPVDDDGRCRRSCDRGFGRGCDRRAAVYTRRSARRLQRHAIARLAACAAHAKARRSHGHQHCTRRRAATAIGTMSSALSSSSPPAT